VGNLIKLFTGNVANACTWATADLQDADSRPMDVVLFVTSQSVISLPQCPVSNSSSG